MEQAASLDAGATIRCDVCIIGAGAAGITIAAELAGSGLDVVMLEGGGRVRETESQDFYRGSLSGSPQFPLELSRLRFLGGTTNHWAGMCRPFDALDFAQRDWVPESGWPLRRADLEPYYERAHPICDLGPYDYGEDPEKTSWPGITDPGPRLADEGDVLFKMVQHSPPTRFRKKYGPLMEGEGGPRVILHASALELVSEPGAGHLRRVAARGPAGKHFDVEARATILATGAVENARLLLLSKRAAPAGLGNDRDLVGRFFMDHAGAIPFAVLLWRDDSYQRIAVDQRVDGIRLLSGLAVSEIAQAREGLLSNAAYLRKPMKAEEIRDFEWFNIVQAITKTLDEDDLEIARFLDQVAPNRADSLGSIAWIRSEQAPNRESRVTLGDELDAHGQRRVALAWRHTELDRHTFMASARLYADVLTRSGIGRVKLMPWLLAEKGLGESEAGSEWSSRLTPGWHHIGTTRMADDPQRGVVDSSCRVFGVDNLYVAGSSVFPTSSYINPTLTLVALAIRLADHLRATLKGQGAV
jgi:choline dehydrogenase-like flavoprotein